MAGGAMRLAEELLQNGAIFGGIERRFPKVAFADRYLIDNINQYYQTGTKQEYWNPEVDFPCPCPPSENLWMEWKPTPSFLIGETVKQVALVAYRQGLLFETVPIHEVDPSVMKKLSITASDGDRWLLLAYSFLQPYKHSRVIGPLLVQSLVLDNTGNPRKGTVREASLTKDNRAVEMREAWFPGLLALSFCNCKNVSSKKVAMNEVVARNRAKDNRPSLTFKILDVAASVTCMRKDSMTGESDIKKALHVCRGHFAVYEDKGLFGKYRGRFWIPQHTKGNSEIGTVIKEYAV